MINHNIQEDAGATKVGGVGQFTKLVDRRSAFIEDDQSGINAREIERCVGTTEPAEACVSSRRGVYGKQMEYSAAEPVDDVRQLLSQIAQFARRRKHRVSVVVQSLEELRGGLVRFDAGGFSGTKHSC